VLLSLHGKLLGCRKGEIGANNELTLYITYCSPPKISVKNGMVNHFY
jgi:hypothetical protein